MPSIEKSIDVNVPVHTAYECWTDFESFPQFMEGVESVNKTGTNRLHWRASIFGKTEEWDAEIVEEIPDSRVAWRSTSGPYNSGTVTFQSTGDNQCRVTCQITYEPQGVMESIGDVLGVLDRQVDADMDRFKDYVETKAPVSGQTWRAA